MSKLVTTAALSAGVAAGTIALVAAPAFATTGVVTGKGNVTVALTSPVTQTGSGKVPMTCAVSGSKQTYAVRIGAVNVRGGTVSASTTVRSYAGPGAYTATVSMTVKDAAGHVLSGSVANVPVTITSTGGSLSFSKVAKGTYVPKLAGKTVAGTITWTCPGA